eukprot:2332091-Amphidinium_carterae.1
MLREHNSRETPKSLGHLRDILGPAFPKLQECPQAQCSCLRERQSLLRLYKNDRPSCRNTMKRQATRDQGILATNRLPELRQRDTIPPLIMLHCWLGVSKKQLEGKLLGASKPSATPKSWSEAPACAHECSCEHAAPSA